MKEQTFNFSPPSDSTDKNLTKQNQLYYEPILDCPNLDSKFNGEKVKTFSATFKAVFSIILFIVMVLVAYGYNQGGVFR